MHDPQTDWNYAKAWQEAVAEIARLTRERDALLRSLEFAKPYVHDALVVKYAALELGQGLTL